MFSEKKKLSVWLALIKTVIWVINDQKVYIYIYIYTHTHTHTNTHGVLILIKGFSV